MTFDKHIEPTPCFCFICNEDLKESVFPTIALATRHKVLFEYVDARISFCWRCFEDAAGKDWGGMLLKRALKIEKKRLGPEHDKVKAIEVAISEYLEENAPP